MKKAFTLVEVLIVVSILGILAAIVMPTFQSHVQLAKEATAKDNLRILRNAIELYASQHNDAPPGYPNGDTSTTPVYLFFAAQLLRATDVNSQVANKGTPGYPYGPYISAIPENPFNDAMIVKVLGNDEDFPIELATDPFGDVGWVYKPATKTVRINWLGNDSKGVPYSQY